MTSRWRGQPLWLRAAVLTLVALLAYGTGVHLVYLVQLLAGGGGPYLRFPRWLGAYFVSLTLLDPLAAVLLARCHRSGVVLAVVVLVTDAGANAVANYTYDDSAGVTTGRIGQAVITCLALAAAALGPAMWRAAGRRDSAR